jgi:hypothetical protein
MGKILGRLFDLIGFLLALAALLFLGWSIAALLATGGVAGAAYTPFIEAQLGAGNSTYGNNTPYVTGFPVVYENFTVPGHFLHISCRNVTGGTCSTPPSFNIYVYHGGVQTNGTAVTCSATAQAIGTHTDQAESLPWVAGDEIGAFISNQASGCNAPNFDLDILVSMP